MNDFGVFKPRMDTRYAKSEITTHNRSENFSAMSIDRWDFWPATVTAIFIDEIQFFEEPYFKGNIVQIIKKLLAGGHNVFVSGLDLDHRGMPFPITAALLAMADEVVKLKAECELCGRPATKSLKMNACKERFQLGGVGLYEPRCNTHW